MQEELDFIFLMRNLKKYASFLWPTKTGSALVVEEVLASTEKSFSKCGDGTFKLDRNMAFPETRSRYHSNIKNVQDSSRTGVLYW